jgi:pyrroline-5-carboxylate reductase
MLNNKKIGFIGSGNMGEALINGLIGSGSAPAENIICSDVREERLESIKKTYGVGTTTNNVEVAAASDVIVYAVKPQIMAPVLRETSETLDMSKLVISIAAGVPLAAIESCLNKDLRLIRVMPNVAASVKEGATAIAAGEHAHEDDIQLAMSIFNSVGRSVFLKENYLMDAVTGLSGSGPAYIFLIVDALADAGVKVGLSRQDALSLSIQTVLGAAKMLQETKAHPHTLEKGGLRTTLINAVEAATIRSKELGEIMMENFSNNDKGGGIKF